jgi:hypothetical protein
MTRLTLRQMVNNPQYVHLRPTLLKEIARLDRRNAIASMQREELAKLPFKVRVRLESKDRAMNTWHSWNVEAKTGPNETWEIIGNTGDTAQGWSAHYQARNGRSIALADRWSVKGTKHEAVLLIAQHHAEVLRNGSS